jgi:hypothetical protein
MQVRIAEISPSQVGFAKVGEFEIGKTQISIGQ